MVERGFFRMLLPRSVGGAELLPAPYVRVVEEIAKGDASAAWCLNQGAGCSMTAAYLESRPREVFGGPRGILAWGPGPGKASIVPGGYRVTATWGFASGSQHATWLGCHVPIIERRRAAPAPGRQAGRPHPGLPESAPKSPTCGTPSGCAAPAATNIRSPTCSCRRRLSRRATTPAAGRRTGCSTAEQPAALRRGLCRGGDGDRPRRRSTPLSHWPATRCRSAGKSTLRDNNVVQAQVAQSEAKLRSARAFLYQSLEEITQEVERAGHITLKQRM